MSKYRFCQAGAAPVFLLISVVGLIAFLLITNTFSFAQTSSPLSNIHHVWIILMENKDWTSVKGNSTAPFINDTILKLGASSNNYHNVPTSMGFLHPSEPNYLWLEGGTNVYPDFTFTTDNNPSSSNSTSSTAHLATLLNSSGHSWRAYQEDMTDNSCPITSVAKYVPKHDPFIFFKDVSGNPPSGTNTYCIQHHSRITNITLGDILQNDLNTGNVAEYNFITPNLCNDMHDCSVATGDTWLSKIVPMIMNSSTYKQDGAIFITWDEGGSGNNPIGMMVLSPFAKVNYTNNIEYSHASTVKTIENIFNLSPYVGHAADSLTVDLSDLFDTSHATSTPTPISTPTPTPSPTPTPTPDTTPPIVKLYKPASGSTTTVYRGKTYTFTLKGTASDNVGVSKVQYSIGSQILCTSYSKDSYGYYSCPITLTVPTTQAIGTYIFYAKGFDTSSNIGQDKAYILVQ